MVEYGARFPLWGTDYPCPGSYGPLRPERNSLGLSNALLLDLLGWQQFWDTHYDFLDGWDEPAHAQQHVRVGSDLLRRVRDETGRDDIRWE